MAGEALQGNGKENNALNVFNIAYNTFYLVAKSFADRTFMQKKKKKDKRDNL